MSDISFLSPDRLSESMRAEFVRLAGDEPPRFAMAADRLGDGSIGETHVAVGASHVVAFGAEPVAFALADVDRVEVEELFGASRLVVATDGGDAVHSLAVYSRNLVSEFAAFCRVVDELRQGREPVLPELDAAVCASCGIQLPERGASCPRCVSRKGVVLRLVRLIQPYRGPAIALLLVTAVSVAAAMVPPYMFKQIADRVIGGGHGDELGFWVGLMAAAFVTEAVFRFVGNWINVWLGARIVADLRARLHERAQRLRMSYHNRHESGELVGRVMHDTGEVQHFLADGLPYFLVNGIAFVSIAVILLMLSWKLALLVFIPVPILILGGKAFFGILRPLFHQRANRVGRMNSMLTESISGVRTVKALGQERRRAGEFNDVNDRLFKVDTLSSRTFAGFFSSMGLLMSAGTVLVWLFGGRAILDGQNGEGGIQLGTLLAFVGYMALFYGPLQWFTAVFNWMTHAMTASERIFAVLDQPTEVYDDPDAVELPRVQGHVKFEGVRFSYERGREVLKGVDLEIPAGTMVGLVGRSGAGKSTIINLVCRFYDPDSGRVLIDGQDLADVQVQSWRRQVGIVMQDPFLFRASILDNIRFGSPEASFEEVMRAARAAHAHDFISAKEEGYDTIVGEGGGGLSGGERQRISIARAILNDPPVLLLDEATSAVDSETEKKIQEAIATLVKGRTTIAIAHRLATLRNADRLMVIDDGEVVEQGTHEELMAKEGGRFAELVRLQTEINQLRSEQAVWHE